ncbi:MAG: hypothetical protein M0R06_17855 [Sphaerochaeta sp.]|jgi:hypothetical protein|nr:hypothetical protein [Sphaerochaeta sp.]
MDAIEAVRFHLHDDGSPPILTDDQVQEFLDAEKVPDADGVLPTDDDWVPTYDVLRAAGRGWLWMAGRPTNKPTSYRVGDVSVSFDKDYCLSRARELLGASCGFIPRRDEVFTHEVLPSYRTEDD